MIVPGYNHVYLYICFSEDYRLKITILFFNLGAYHLARLASAKSSLDDAGIQLDVIEIAGNTNEHPWGGQARPAYVRTLSKFARGDLPTVDDPSLLTRALKAADPDLIAIPGWGYDFSRIAIKWGKRNGKRLILMSESKYDDSPRNFIKELVKKHVWVNKFDAGLVGGQKHFDYLAKLGMQKSRIFTGYDVVDNQYFTSEVERLHAEWSEFQSRPKTFPANKFFLAANRFIPRKNLIRLINSFSDAVATGQMNSDWDLVLLGSGTDEQTSLMKATIAENQLETRIHCPGFITTDQITKWYAAASAFVHPALSEQWGLVVNEAMAAGLPILLSNTCGCHPELLDEGINGFSFNPHSRTEMTDKMIQMANADLESLGQASKEKIRRDFSTTSFGIGLLQGIKAITENRSEKPQ